MGCAEEEHVAPPTIVIKLCRRKSIHWFDVIRWRMVQLEVSKANKFCHALLPSSSHWNAGRVVEQLLMNKILRVRLVLDTEIKKTLEISVFLTFQTSSLNCSDSEVNGNG